MSTTEPTLKRGGLSWLGTGRSTSDKWPSNRWQTINGQYRHITVSTWRDEQEKYPERRENIRARQMARRTSGDQKAGKQGSERGDKGEKVEKKRLLCQTITQTMTQKPSQMSNPSQPYSCGGLVELEHLGNNREIREITDYMSGYTKDINIWEIDQLPWDRLLSM